MNIRGQQMLINPEILKAVLYDAGLQRHEVLQVITNSLMAQQKDKKQHDISTMLNYLFYMCSVLKIQPSAIGEVSERDACMLLGKSAGYLKAARHAGRHCPEARKVGNKYVYKLQDLAEYAVN